MLSLKTPAKINLFLNLRKPRADGFHEVCFIMQTVGIYDTLTLAEHPDGLAFTCNRPGLTESPADNLVVRAYHRFFKGTGLSPVPLKVTLEKQIPVQAGLGGGSSDAAAMLRALNTWTGANVEPSALSAMAADLGSDVPFFLTGGTALAIGRGELIQPLQTTLPPLPLMILKPKSLDISTLEAYRQVREAGRYETVSEAPFLAALSLSCLGSPFKDAVEPYLLNDFERVLYGIYPQLSEMAKAMRAVGIRRPLLSGSGPAMVGFLDPARHTRELLESAFPIKDYELFITETCPGES